MFLTDGSVCTVSLNKFYKLVWDILSNADTVSLFVRCPVWWYIEGGDKRQAPLGDVSPALQKLVLTSTF